MLRVREDRRRLARRDRRGEARRLERQRQRAARESASGPPPPDARPPPGAARRSPRRSAPRRGDVRRSAAKRSPAGSAIARPARRPPTSGSARPATPESIVDRAAGAGQASSTATRSSVDGIRETPGRSVAAARHAHAAVAGTRRVGKPARREREIGERRRVSPASIRRSAASASAAGAASPRVPATRAGQHAASTVAARLHDGAVRAVTLGLGAPRAGARRHEPRRGRAAPRSRSRARPQRERQLQVEGRAPSARRARLSKSRSRPRPRTPSSHGVDAPRHAVERAAPARPPRRGDARSTRTSRPPAPRQDRTRLRSAVEARSADSDLAGHDAQHWRTHGGRTAVDGAAAAASASAPGRPARTQPRGADRTTAYNDGFVVIDILRRSSRVGLA